MIFAFGFCDLIARNAAELAVPPPIKRYGTSFGISDDDAGIFAMKIEKNGDFKQFIKNKAIKAKTNIYTKLTFS